MTTLPGHHRRETLTGSGSRGNGEAQGASSTWANRRWAECWSSLCSRSWMLSPVSNAVELATARRSAAKLGCLQGISEDGC